MAKRNQARRRQEPASIGKKSAVVRIEPFQITWDPIEDPALEQLPATVRERMPELHAAVCNGEPERILPELTRYYAQFPELPVFGNWLTKALTFLGRGRDALRVSRQIHARHPDYLFARVHLARQALAEGRIEEAGRLLGPTLSLPSLYPDRAVFHVSEVMTYVHAVGEFALAIGDGQHAHESLRFLQAVEPTHPATRDLKRLLNPPTSPAAEMRALIRSLAGTSGETRHRRAPSRAKASS